jgi:tetratricopeptide (TPR) repeat protein
MDSGQNPTKTVLELALELGVRTEAVLSCLQKMGAEPEDISSAVDSSLEDILIDQMVSEGIVPSRLAKGKGKRKLTDEPLADDDLMRKALGASRNGFSEQNIPKPIRLEQDQHPPSLLQRWFGSSPKNLVRSLKDHALDPEELRSYFPDSEHSVSIASSSPFIEDERSQETEASEQEITSEPVRQFETISIDEDLEEIDLEDELEGLEVDEDILHDLDAFDLGDDHPEAPAGEQPEELEDLEIQLDDADLDTLSLDELDIDVSDEVEKELKDVEELLPSVELSIDGADSEENNSSLAERFFSYFQFNTTELWAMMIGAVSLVLLCLGITIYWWWNFSMEEQNHLFTEAMLLYQIAQEADMEWEMDRSANAWVDVQEKWRRAAGTFEEFIDRFGSNPNAPTALYNLADSYYQIATGYEKNGEPSLSQEPFRYMAALYRELLEQQNKIANTHVGADPEKRYLAYPNPDVQRTAILRIATAERKLGNYDTAIERLRQFVRDFRTSDDALEAQLMIGDSYRDWAATNREEEPALLHHALTAYRDALSPEMNMISEDDHVEKMNVYAGLGDIAYHQYEISMNNEKPEEADDFLKEAVLYYESAEQEARAADPNQLPFSRKIQVFDKLADLYILNGRESGKNWRDFEERGMKYAEGIDYRRTLLDEAERQKALTQDFLTKANVLYDELLQSRDEIPPKTLYGILYNKADSAFILQDYPETIALGNQLVQDISNLNPTEKARVYYLMGHAAWEQAKHTEDYSGVKQYYRDALQLDPLYPAQQKGETSHLAEIRLTNAYFMLDGKYEDAIARFQDAIKKYPETGYTYLTLYWYGIALDEYGDILMAQAQEMEEQGRSVSDSQLVQEAENIRTKAREQYRSAVDIYERAIASREHSRYVDTRNNEYLTQIVFHQGQSAFKAGQYRDATQYLVKALQKYGDEEVAQQYIPQALETLGDANHAIANYPQAIHYYRDYLQRHFGDQDARVSMKLADAYLNQFSYDKGRETLRSIIKYYPPPSEREVKSVLQNGKRIEPGPGIEALKKIAESYIHQASISSESSKRREHLLHALEAYQELATHNPLDAGNPQLPNDMDAILKTGNINYELENYAAAAANYEALLNSWGEFPRSGMVSYRLGQSYAQMEIWDKAIEALSGISPTTMDNTIQYADALILLGHAFESRANDYLKQNDEDFYLMNLENARNAYNRVTATGVQEKVTQALLRRQAIDTLLESRRELAANPGSTP